MFNGILVPHHPCFIHLQTFIVPPQARTVTAARRTTLAIPRCRAGLARRARVTATSTRTCRATATRPPASACSAATTPRDSHASSASQATGATPPGRTAKVGRGCRCGCCVSKGWPGLSGNDSQAKQLRRYGAESYFTLLERTPLIDSWILDVLSLMGTLWNYDVMQRFNESCCNSVGSALGFRLPSRVINLCLEYSS